MIFYLFIYKKTCSPIIRTAKQTFFIFSRSTLQRGTISFDPAHNHKRVAIGGWRFSIIYALFGCRKLIFYLENTFYIFLVFIRDFLIAEAIKMLSPGTATYMKPRMLLRVILVTRWCKIWSWLVFLWAISKIDHFKFE